MHAGTHADTETHSIDGTQGVASVCCLMATTSSLSQVQTQMGHRHKHMLLLLVLAAAFGPTTCRLLVLLALGLVPDSSRKHGRNLPTIVAAELSIGGTPVATSNPNVPNCPDS